METNFILTIVSFFNDKFILYLRNKFILSLTVLLKTNKAEPHRLPYFFCGYTAFCFP